MRAALWLAIILALVPASSLAGQQPVADAPPPPVAPSVISRVSGRATIRAVRVPTPLRIDGKLDEAVYESVPSMTDFIQQEPSEGQPATEKTEVWLLYNDDAVYVVARCWESQPQRVIANEMRQIGRAHV